MTFLDSCPRCGGELRQYVKPNGVAFDECHGCGFTQDIRRRPATPDEQADRKQWAKARIGHAAFLGFCTREAA